MTMNYTASINLSDSSRHSSNTGSSGFFFNVASIDYNFITSIIFDTTNVSGDTTFLQQQILGPGDLPLLLNQWSYVGGIEVDSTFSGGRWMERWFDPSYIKYSIWYLNYDSSTYSLIGYQHRDPTEVNVGNYYAPLQIPTKPGHYQIRWLYTLSSDSYGSQIINSFTSVSRGLDAMPDYPYQSGWQSYPYGGTPSEAGGDLITTLPVYEYRNPEETAVFTLQFNGPVPAPFTYQWRFNGNTIIGDGTKFVGTDTNTLIINNLLLTDGGIYTCVVANQVVSSYAFLVMDPPG